MTFAGRETLMRAAIVVAFVFCSVSFFALATEKTSLVSG